MPLNDLQKIQAVVTGSPDEVRASLQRYIDAGARHLVVRLAALDRRSQHTQLTRLAALIPALQAHAASIIVRR
jgi:hypothetical protein